MTMSSKSGVASSISMMRVVTRAKTSDFYSETLKVCSQSEARNPPFARGVMATHKLTNQNLC